MMKMKNETHIEGYLYEHTLEIKESGPNSKNPGTKFITGTVSVATDEACLNIVPSACPKNLGKASALPQFICAL